AIGERPTEVTDDSKWDEMDGNAIANLHLALADGVLSSIEEKKSAKKIWDHLARFRRPFWEEDMAQTKGGTGKLVQDTNSRSVYVLVLVELDSREKIKYLRIDNGGEYIGGEFDTFCRQKDNQMAVHNGIHPNKMEWPDGL
ncbi:gag-pol polyprotein, partial [Tanacetum coccineum]